MPYMGLNFLLYETTKKLSSRNPSTLPSSSSSKKSISEEIRTVFINGICGATAGGVSKFIVFPLVWYLTKTYFETDIILLTWLSIQFILYQDTIKKKMQGKVLYNHFDPTGGTKFGSIWQCVRHTLRHEGVRGFYKVSC